MDLSVRARARMKQTHRNGYGSELVGKNGRARNTNATFANATFANANFANDNVTFANTTFAHATFANANANVNECHFCQ